jgi:hypothetical protein
MSHTHRRVDFILSEVQEGEEICKSLVNLELEIVYMEDHCLISRPSGPSNTKILTISKKVCFKI